MTLLISTGSKSAIATLIANAYSGGVIRIFAGTRPSGVDQSETQNDATLLGVVTNGGLPVGFLGSGLSVWETGPYVVNDPTQEWILTPTYPGTATWFRYVADPSDDGGISYTAHRMDADIGAPGDAELVLPDTSLVAGVAVGPLSFVYTVPPVIS